MVVRKRKEGGIYGWSRNLLPSEARCAGVAGSLSARRAKGHRTKDGKLGVHPDVVKPRQSDIRDRSVTPPHERSSATEGPSASPATQVASAGAFGFGGRVALLLANLVATPFTIRLLGPTQYGLWALLQLGLTWALLADVGMGSASTKFGADRYARGDSRGEAAIVWLALAVTGITTACLASVVAIEAPAILSDLLRVHGALLPSAVLALRLTCVLFLVQALAGTIKAPMVVRLRWRQYTLINSAANLFSSVGTPIALALLAGGVVTAAGIGLGAAALALVASLIAAIRLQPALRHPHRENGALRQLLGYGGGLTVAGFASIPLSTAERFFLASNHSTAVVAYYAVAATLATTLTVLPEQLVGPLFPSLTRLETQGRIAEHRALYRKSLAGLFLVLTPLAIMLAVVARPFLSLWAGPAYGIHSSGPFLVVICGVWLNCLAWVPYSYLLSSGRTNIIAMIQVAEVLPYLLGAWLLTSRYGAMGAAIIWSATFAVDSLIFLFMANRVAGLPFSPFSDRPARALLVLGALIVSAAGAVMVSHLLVYRVLWVVGLSLAYAVAVWRLVLTSGERRGLVQLFNEVTGRGPAPRHARMGF